MQIEASGENLFVPWRVRDVLLGLLAVAVGALLATVLAAYWGLRAGSKEAAIIAAMVSVEGILLLVVWGFAVLRYRCGWRILGFRSLNRRDLVLVFAVFLLSVAISRIYIVGIALSGLTSFMPPTLSSLAPRAPAELMAFGVVAVVLTPIAEETFFRGFVLMGLVQRFGIVKAAAASSLLFALAHIHIGLLLPTFLLGLLLAWLYLRTRSVWSCALTHLAFNGLAFASLG